MAPNGTTAAPAAAAAASSGQFFGVTTLGAADPFADLAATTQAYPFHHELHSEEAFLAAFDSHLLAATARGRTHAAILQVDGSSVIMRGELGAVLNDVLGRPARRAELTAWFTFLDFDRGALMGRDEFAAGVRQLREWSASPPAAQTYTSFARWRSDLQQHRRLEQGAQRTLQAPVTAAQAVGWHAPKPHAAAPPGERFTLPHTDVTRREGRTHASYYGESLG